MTYQRQLFHDLERILKAPSPVMHVLIGPRQVGKTTIAKQLVDSLGIPAVMATADSPTPLDGAWIETQWRRAAIQAGSTSVFLVLDEVQKVGGWSESIKLLWDGRNPDLDIRVLLLGSSALLMQEGLTESLAGRFLLHRCPHWSFAESRDAFGWSLPQWLYFGGYPGAAAFAHDESLWRRYIVDSLIETVLARDVHHMARVGKPILLRHLFALAASLPAQIVSYTKMLGQLQDAGNTTTLAHYVRLLEGAFLLSGLEQFSRGVQRRRGSSPKLVLWNNALVSALGTRHFADAGADQHWWGRLVENAVGAHLCNGLGSMEYALTYWREGKYEVDFVVEHGRDVWALEVKSGSRGDSKGLQRFQARYPEARPIMIGGPGIPLEEFFSIPPGQWFG